MVEIVLSSSNVMDTIETTICSGTFAVAHCVSEDMQMGKGLAVSFKLKYGHIGALLDQNVSVGGIAEQKIVNNHAREVYIFYLVTKMFYYQKPSIQSLASTLTQLRDKLTDLSIDLLIIPKLGCCSDGLNWYEVSNLLRTTFSGGNMRLKVIVCDPENFQMPLHQIASLSELKIEFLECGAPGTLLILPIEITNASENSTFQKCLEHFKLSQR
ncbi:ADP-ribose glycohydrolase OARD1-like [Aphis gossypii]|uniref:ADP-ribose glycohydrolase OARD1-like n=1 Tax=Aphis gossypii TaxID=80765 RepID=UPI002159321F|nr:ADP-ribose glycohydrolase OARD1-like [Aphis gossypii]